jgi:hypothetical protein
MDKSCQNIFPTSTESLQIMFPVPMTENEVRTELVNNLIYLFVHMNIIANPWLVGAGIANLLSVVGKVSIE